MHRTHLLGRLVVGSFLLILTAGGGCKGPPPPDDGGVTLDLSGGGPDLSQGPGPDLSVRPPDLSVRPPDLSQPPDMSELPPDMRLPCTGSADCPGEFCCANFTLGPGKIPTCPIVSYSVACKASCNGNIQTKCDVTDQARICQGSADCAGDPGKYKNCCPIDNGMTKQNLCVTDLIKLVLGVTCLP